MNDAPSVAIIAFEERDQHESGFAEFFDTRIKDKLLALDEQRVAVRRRYWWRILAVVVAVAVGAGAFGLLISNYVAGRGTDAATVLLSTAGIAFLVAAIAALWARWIRRRFSRQQKTALIPEILSFIGEFGYDPAGRLDKSVLQSSGLFHERTAVRSEDLISGTYHDRLFQFAEAAQKKGRGEEGGAGFRGFVVTVDLAEETDKSGLADAIERLRKVSDTGSVEHAVTDGKLVIKIESGTDLLAPKRLGVTLATDDRVRDFLREINLALSIVAIAAEGTET